MPLSFNSVSHGTIAFGFFNIDSDMLLLDHYFFFANELCEYISDITESDGKESFKMICHVYYISDNEDIGDLVGAIQGTQYTGFIGELYERFPFPKNLEVFKQMSNGFRKQAIVKEIIEKYARYIEISIAVKKSGQGVEIGAYEFNRASFQEMIKYIWRGGYPRWKDEKRPDYVMVLREKVERSCNGLFKGIVFDE
jgi:hypothetical protein